jgi:hypothetical protein
VNSRIVPPSTPPPCATGGVTGRRLADQLGLMFLQLARTELNIFRLVDVKGDLAELGGNELFQHKYSVSSRAGTHSETGRPRLEVQRVAAGCRLV